MGRAMNASRWGWLLALGLCACVDGLVGGHDDRDVTSVKGAENTIEWDGFVYVDPGAGDDGIGAAIRRQVKSSLGALREQGIGIRDRDAQRNLDPTSWIRTPLRVVDADGTPAERVLRVTYHYRDTALVDRSRTAGAPLELPLLFGDYQAHYADLVPACTDERTPAGDSLWYHYHPGRSACRQKIATEASAIDDTTAALTEANDQISRADRDRLFMPTRAVLTPADDPRETFPEYDRLWGFAGDTSRTMLVAYAFFGVDQDESNPHDYGLREMLRYQRTLRQHFPQLHVVRTDPFSMLLDFWVDGKKLDGVTWNDVENWVIDNTGFPPEASTPAQRDQLLAQVVEHFSERWIYWELPVDVELGGVHRNMTVQIRVFQGYEDGNPEVRQHAQWRYLEAFWDADIFSYTGHSHFGHGPLAPFYYGAGNFPWRYQVMLINSCLSFNYYDQDFIDVHPGGSGYLDVVTNGLAAYWEKMDEASARYLIALIDGHNDSWSQLLQSMHVDLPWQRGYDPMRAVNGEPDNQFDARATPITVRVRD